MPRPYYYLLVNVKSKLGYGEENIKWLSKFYWYLRDLDKFIILQLHFSSNMEVREMWPICLAVIIIIIIVIMVMIYVSYYNKIIRNENRIDNAYAQIDVQLKRRADLIPNLMETVKGYMKHEKEVLENVTKARTSLMHAQTPQENIEADNLLTGALKSLFAVAENYPDLKANQNFLQLQDELSHTENKVAYARQHYNDSVLAFNNSIETFPGIWIARMMGRSEKQMLEVPEVDKELPKVKF
jgi:LemA protein